MTMNLTKRIVSLILTLALVLSCFPMAAFAEENVQTITETVASAAAETEPSEAETGASTFPPVPEETTEPTVTETEIPEDAESLDTYALAAADIVDSGALDTTIDWRVSSDGVLTLSGRGAVVPQKGITEYPWDKYCDEIKTLVFEEGITLVQIGMFHLWAVTHLSLPESMTEMAHAGFCHLESLETVEIPSGNPSFCVKDNVVFTKDMSTLIGYPAARPATAYRIPDGVNGIAYSAGFLGSKNLVELTIPASVTSIGHYAVSECPNLKHIYFEGDAPELGYYLFYDLEATVYYPADNPTWTSEVIQGDYGGNLTWIPYNGRNETVVASGECGDDLTWKLNDAGVLTISGTGPMWEYAEVNDASWIPYETPWQEYTEETPITAIVIGPGVTSIGSGAFYNLSQLVSVSVPSGVTSIGGRAFAQCSSLSGVTIPATVSEIGKYAFAYCPELEEVIIPDGVACINTGTFLDCGKLTWVTIPASVVTVDILAFSGCTGLQTVFFGGSAAQWDAIDIREANEPLLQASREYIQLPDGEDPEEMPDWHNTLEELTGVDYLAFAQVAYEDFVTGETVQECLTRKKGNKWDNVWGEEDITYAQLCEGIAQWKVCHIEENTENGFYAVAFRNESGEAVLAYRGSKPLTSALEMVADEQASKDWVSNDLAMILFNEVTDENQYNCAITAYKQTKKVSGIHTVVTTGHSLGGLWGEIASAYSGCKGITFNSISALDIMYVKHPIALGREFRGIDAWNFTDHINVYDILAGAMELASSELGLAVKLKPFIAYNSNYGIDNIIGSHSLKSLVSRSGDKLVLNQYAGAWEGSSGVSGHLKSTSRSIDMGVSGEDYFDRGLTLADSRSAFGGDGFDKIFTGIHSDTIVGGDGWDILDGGWGDDTYYYFKGDGCDTIIDIGGRDALRLEGFSDDDMIEMYEGADSDYISIRCNGSTIVNIYKKNRDYSVATLGSFKVYINGGQENNITQFFSKYRSGCHLLVRCPVSVEILDREGNVVFTLEDGTVGAHYTDYGNFYVFEEEDGGYGKTLDLAEGYTARIVGEDTGTMKIEYRDAAAGELAEPKCFENVPVSDGFTAILEETMGGELVLAADTDGDGTVDAKIGYDGTTVPVESLMAAEEYIVLQVGQQTQLHAVVSPWELAQLLRWSVEEGSEQIIHVASDGTVTGLQTGTGYARATLESGGVCKTVRCRVDVAETQIPDEGQTGGTAETVELEGIRLSTDSLTTELFSDDFTEFEILLLLPQNYPVATTYSRRGGGIVMENACFTDETMAGLFGLVVLDDRRVRLVPSDEAVDNAKEVKSKYTGTITVTVQGKTYETEKVTLNVRKTMPKLKATVGTFNSFYADQSQKIIVTGGTVTGIRENEDMAVPIPAWLKLEDGSLKLSGETPKPSDKVHIWVDVEGWSTPAALTLSVKHSYKAPALKMSAGSVTLNTLTGDSKDICVTSSFADYVPTELEITGNAGDALTIKKQGNVFTVSTNDRTVAGKTYKVTVQAANIKAVTLTVRTVDKNPVMNPLKVKGTMDVTFPGNKAIIGVSLKDYAGAFVPVLTIKDSDNIDVTNKFISIWNGTQFEVVPNTAGKGTYTATVAVDMGGEGIAISTKTAKLTVKQTLPKVTLSSVKVTLNKKLNSSAVIDVISATKGYELDHSRVDVEVPAQINAAYDDGKITVSLKESADYGKTYKVSVRACAGAPAVTLQISVPAQNKSGVTAALKATGFIDVIRAGTAITVTPSFTNAFAADMESMELRFYKKDGKIWTDITGEKYFTAEELDGEYVVTAGENLSCTDKYQAELVAKVGDQVITTKRIALNVKMGSTKLTLKSSEMTLFAKDRNDCALVWFEPMDGMLNEVAAIEIKDAKYKDAFEIFDYGDGIFAIGFRNGTLHKEIRKQIEKKTRATVTLNLNVFLEGNNSTKANASVKVKLSIVR